MVPQSDNVTEPYADRAVVGAAVLLVPAPHRRDVVPGFAVYDAFGIFGTTLTEKIGV
jgi:hypothetical protein